MRIVYYIGSNWATNGSPSLYISGTYLGTHKGERTFTSSIILYIAIGLFLAYSWICVIFTIKIIKQSNRLSIIANFYNQTLEFNNNKANNGNLDIIDEIKNNEYDDENENENRARKKSWKNKANNS